MRECGKMRRGSCQSSNARMRERGMRCGIILTLHRGILPSDASKTTLCSFPAYFSVVSKPLFRYLGNGLPAVPGGTCKKSARALERALCAR